MKLKTKYIVVNADDLVEFESLVQKYLDDNWFLQGGVSVLYEGDTVYYQAMVKEVY